MSLRVLRKESVQQAAFGARPSPSPTHPNTDPRSCCFLFLWLPRLLCLLASLWKETALYLISVGLPFLVLGSSCPNE